MPEDPGQAPTSTLGQDPTNTGTGTTPPAAAPDAKPPVETFDLDYVRKLREEAAGHRTRANDLAAKLKEREDADKSELQKSQERVAELEKAAGEHAAALRQERARVAITDLAVEQGLKPALALKLLSADVQFDDAGAVQMDPLKKALAQIVADNPGLVARAGGTNAANPGRQDGAPPSEAEIRARMMRVPGGSFTIDGARLRGGGVFLPEGSSKG